MMKYPQPVSDILTSAVSLAAEVGPDELVYRARHVEEMLEAMRTALSAPVEEHAGLPDKMIAAHHATGKLMQVVEMDSERQSVHVKWMDGPDPSQWPDVHYNYAELELLPFYPIRVEGWIVLCALHRASQSLNALHKTLVSMKSFVEVHKATLSKWLGTMEDVGWVVKDSAGSYILTEAGREVCRL